jgi:predicted acetyltransferase
MIPPPDTLGFEGVRLRYEGAVPGDEARGLVPYYHFRILTPDGEDAGHINLRVGDTPHVQFAAGQVGYEISPAFRGRALAYRACQALAPFAKSLYPTLLLTTDPDNVPSIRTIEKLGATFLDEVAVPEDDPHALRGSLRKRRYEWTP